MKRIAAIDVGSNGIRLAIGEIADNSSFHPVRNFREPVRIGRDVFRDGFIREQTAYKALKAFHKFKKILKKFRVEEYLAFATSATRDAKNGKAFVEYLRKRTGLKLTMIDGKKEAQLIHSAVFSRINLSNCVAVMLDIGGGSMELTVSKFGKIEASKSFQVGTVRILNEIDMSFEGPKSNSIIKILKPYREEIKKFFRRSLDGSNYFIFVGTGGNIECLGELKQNLLKDSEVDFVTPKELQLILNQLEKLSYEEKLSVLGLRPDRADVIVPATLVVKSVMELCRARGLVIPYIGLKDGILLDLARHSRMLPIRVRPKKKSQKKSKKKAKKGK